MNVFCCCVTNNENSLICTNTQKVSELEKIVRPFKALNSSNILAREYDNVINNKSFGQIEIIYFCKDMKINKRYFVHSELLTTNYFIKHIDESRKITIIVEHNLTPYDFLLWLYKKDIDEMILLDKARLDSFILLAEQLNMVNLNSILVEVAKLATTFV